MKHIPQLYLASKSPRRRELLGSVLSDFKVLSLDFEELQAPKKILPSQATKFVKAVAMDKVRQAYLYLEKKNRENFVIISADTLVFHQNRALGKPRNKKEAKKFLRSLSGKHHFVITAVCVLAAHKNRIRCDSLAVKTDVQFVKMKNDFIDWYVETGEPMDKAGAYGAQSKGAAFIAAINGSYSSVIGLPLAETLKLLEEVSQKHWSTWC